MLWLLLAFALCGPPVHAQKKKKQQPEYAVKAAFLNSFFKYVTWPKTKSRDKELVIGILGKNPFGKHFDRIDGKIRKGTKKKLVIKRWAKLPAASELTSCHILFICASEKDSIDKILTRLDKAPVLTIGDSKDLAKKGLMLNLVFVGKHVRWEINPYRAKQARLVLSSLVMRIAVKKIPAPGRKK